MQVFLALAAIVGAFAFGLGILVIDRIEARAVRLATQAATDEAVVVAGMIASEVSRTGATMAEAASRFRQDQLQGADLTVELRDDRGRLLFPNAESPEEPGTVTVEAPVMVEGRRVGAVHVAKPTLVMRLMLADFAPTVLVISLVLGAAAAIAAAWIGRAIAAPIEALSEFSERVSHGERRAAPPIGYGREVTRLTQSIDSMRRQLEGRPFVETFAADLSHELKNPVAAIRASAEVLDESALDDPEAARRFVKRIREATERIERLLKELLSLAAIEARGVQAFEPLDLSKIAQSVADACDVRERIELSLDRDAKVRGDPGWLARATSNLVDNALVHSPPGTPVRVQVHNAEESVVLGVKSSGAVPPHVGAKAFNRFVTTRADKGGTGLGLSIVRAVAEAHGGRAELSSSGPPDVEFRLVLPRANVWARPASSNETMDTTRS
jgi:signal transduction histidine kinase